MLHSYEPVKNTVISKELLVQLVDEQESPKKSKHATTSLEEIEQIRLEFRSE